MLNFSFSVGSAEDARVAAEVCDFLAEQLTTPTKRARRSSKTPEVTNDKQDVVQPEQVADVKDPAALYAALTGGTTAAEALPAETPVVVDREALFAKTKVAVSARGTSFIQDYFKTNNPTGKKFSDFSVEELTAIYDAAVAV